MDPQDPELYQKIFSRFQGALNIKNGFLNIYLYLTVQLERKDGSFISVYLDRPEKDSFSIAILIPSNQRESSKRIHDSLKKGLLDDNFCAVTLERKEEDLSLTERIEDHLLFLERIETGLISEWDGNYSVIGQGDGGRIGAKIAEKASALILIASGGAWPPIQEVLFSFRTQMAGEGFEPNYVRGFLVDARREFKRALEDPSAYRESFGHTHKYWHSLAKMNLVEDLSKVKCPI